MIFAHFHLSFVLAFIAQTDDHTKNHYYNVTTIHWQFDNEIPQFKRENALASVAEKKPGPQRKAPGCNLRRAGRRSQTA